MRAFLVDARYLPYIESVITGALHDVRNDIERRADEDERVQQLATVPEQFINHNAVGRSTILVGSTADRRAVVDLLVAAAGAIHT